MLQLSNLTFSYRGKNIFNQTSVIFPDTGIVAIVGDNGSGKTTLLKLLTGELSPDDGTVRIDDDFAYLPQQDDSLPEKSGGERTRFLLEQIFTEAHAILLLDEPTNNLDGAAKLWLRDQLLLQCNLSVAVSHDRDFINQVADYILEVKDQKLQLYPGNYDDYVARIEQHHDEQLFAYEKARKAATKVSRRLHQAQAHSAQTNRSHYNKIRDENRMVFLAKRNHAQNTSGKIIRSAKTELDRLQEIKRPLERKTYRAQISADFLRRRRLLAICDLAKTYHERKLFSNLNFELYTGERCRVAGGNGAGKTTLFKIILNQITADAGAIKLAPNLKLGYISQEVYGLDLDKTFLAQGDALVTNIFQAAATMDLTKADLTAPCRELSRGQLSKLAFLKVTLSPVDLLILDEPTNHLDIRARNNIESALVNYPGAILFATHDENFATALHPDQILHL